MKDQYVGDVGDFGKYGLLRALTGMTAPGRPLKLGVVWYLTPPDANNAGGQVAYLQPKHEPRFRPCDPPLYDELKDIVGSGERRVKAVEESGVLGPEAVFHRERLTFRGVAPNERVKHRARWFDQAVGTVASPIDVVFVDPDNGIEPASFDPQDLNAPKHVIFRELETAVRRGQTLIAYHHFGHHRPHKDQIRDRLREIDRRLRPEAPPFALRYHPWHPRAFFVVPAPADEPLLRSRAEGVIHGPWRKHFDGRIYTP